MNEVQQVFNFIQDTYNVLNGKINMYVPTMLNIVFSENKKDKMAWNENGILSININKMPSIATNTDNAKTLIIDIMAHELSHIDQKIDFNRYKKDRQYYEFIEGTNMLRSARGILDNLAYIQRMLNVKINLKYIYDQAGRYKQDIRNFPYLTNSEYIKGSVEGIFKLNNEMISAIKYSPYLSVCIKDRKIPLVSEKGCLPIADTELLPMYIQNKKMNVETVIVDEKSNTSIIVL